MVVARKEGWSRSARRPDLGAVPDDGPTGNQGISELRELLAAVEAYRSAVAEGIRAAREVLAAGDLRDASADVRDVEATQREHGRDLAELLDVTTEYGVDWPERRAATLDRERAKQDRIAARLDRWMLADQIRRLVQAGGKGVRQEAVLSLPDGPVRIEEPATRRRVRGRISLQVEATTLRQMQLTGAVWVDGVEQPINLDVASWEEAVARLNQRYGPDSQYVLSTDVAVARP